MDEAEYCHRLALMYRGKVIALGAPAELKHGLTAHSLLQLDTSRPAGDHARARRAGRRAGRGGVRRRPARDGGRSGRDHARASGSALAAKGIEVQRLEQIEPSMEDVFVAMIEAEERKAA